MAKDRFARERLRRKEEALARWIVAIVAVPAGTPTVATSAPYGTCSGGRCPTEALGVVGALYAAARRD